jgi:hypothetical protein
MVWQEHIAVNRSNDRGCTRDWCICRLGSASCRRKGSGWSPTTLNKLTPPSPRPKVSALRMLARVFSSRTPAPRRHHCSILIGGGKGCGDQTIRCVGADRVLRGKPGQAALAAQHLQGGGPLSHRRKTPSLVLRISISSRKAIARRRSRPKFAVNSVNTA